MSAQSALAWYVNTYRKSVGVRPATTSWALQVAATNHARDMARMNRMTHTGSNGSNGGQRITAAGFRWTHVGREPRRRADHLDSGVQRLARLTR